MVVEVKALKCDHAAKLYMYFENNNAWTTINYGQLYNGWLCICGCQVLS